VLRSASGFCFAGIYVVAESWLNDRAENRTRGALLSVYMIVLYGGLGLGQFLLELADPSGGTLFILVAVLISLAVVPMALTAQRAPDFALPQRVVTAELFHISPLGVVGVAVSGIAGGTVFSLGSVYAAASGFGTRAIAAFMASSILTTVLVQLPLGRLSDRLDRRSVLAAMSVLAGLAAAVALLLADPARLPFFVAAALCGGLSMSMYSLAVAHINDHLRPQQMVAASGTLILVNGVGAVFGPLLVAAAMQWTSDEAYFAALALAHFGFAAYALWRKARGSVILHADKTPFVASQPQSAPTGRLAASSELRTDLR
jgi:MFS family permease